MQASYGMFGTAIIKNNDGTFYAPSGVDAKVVSNAVPGVVVPLLVTSELASKLTYEQDLRGADVREFYDKYAVGIDRLLPPVMMSDSDLQTVSQTFADWIANGGATEGFSTFVDQCKGLGLDTYLDTYQKALDAFNAN